MLQTISSFTLRTIFIFCLIITAFITLGVGCSVLDKDKEQETIETIPTQLVDEHPLSDFSEEEQQQVESVIELEGVAEEVTKIISQLKEEKIDNSMDLIAQVSSPTASTDVTPNISAPTKVLISCNGQSYEDTCTPQGLKSFCGPDKLFCATQQQIDDLKVCNGITYTAVCSAGSDFFCPSSGNAYCKPIDTSPSLINPVNQELDLIKQWQQKEDDLPKQQEIMKNSPECKEASASLDRIREEIKSARAESDKYYNEYKVNKDSSLFLKYMEYSRKATNLASEQSFLLSDYYRVCEGTSVIPPIPNTYSTTCYTNSYGLTNCTTY